MDEYYDDYKRKTYIPSDFSILEEEKFDPEVWGPHYWFFLHTVSHTYPLHPNSVTKRKYYDLIKKPAITIPIETKEYKTLAKRPNYSVLDCENTYDLLEIKPSHWKENLVQILEELKNKNS